MLMFYSDKDGKVKAHVQILLKKNAPVAEVPGAIQTGVENKDTFGGIKVTGRPSVGRYLYWLYRVRDCKTPKRCSSIL